MPLSRSILSMLLLIATVGLTTSGAISYSLHSRALDQRIDDASCPAAVSGEDKGDWCPE